MEEKLALNERCTEVQKQNYYLSLDHRSFYFRQQDKKDITTKVLVDTIKEAAMKADGDADGESKKRFDESAPHKSFHFTDPSIHKQVIRLLLVTAKKQFTKSEMVELLNLLFIGRIPSKRLLRKPLSPSSI